MSEARWTNVCMRAALWSEPGQPAHANPNPKYQGIGLPEQRTACHLMLQRNAMLYDRCNCTRSLRVQDRVRNLSSLCCSHRPSLRHTYTYNTVFIKAGAVVYNAKVFVLKSGGR